MIGITEEEVMTYWRGDVSKPLVSICSITYNHEKYIAEALDGILNQKTNFPFEIILDDDCSSDNNALIIKKYVEKFPKIIKANLRKINVGMKTNVIENLKRAQGKYIALCEGDDFWIDELKLQKQVDFLEENPDYALISSRAFVNQIDGNILGMPGTYSYRDILEKNCFLTLTVMFRSENFDQTTTYLLEGLNVGDWPISISMLKHGKGMLTDDITAVYRIHAGGVFSTLNTYQRCLKMLKNYVSLVQKKEVFSQNDCSYLIKGARKEMGSFFVYSTHYEKREIIAVLDAGKQFLMFGEYFFFKYLIFANKWFFGRVSWRILDHTK